MKRFPTVGFIVLTVLVVASCNLFQADAPELQVIVEPRDGNPAADMASGNEIDFGKPGDGNNEDVLFTIRNNSTADLVLEAAGPDYVSIVAENDAEEPFSVLTGSSANFIGPDQEVSVTIRFVGQSTSTRYTAKLLIPSNDEEHPDYFLELVGDGDSFS